MCGLELKFNFNKKGKLLTPFYKKKLSLDAFSDNKDSVIKLVTYATQYLLSQGQIAELAFKKSNWNIKRAWRLTSVY